MSQLIKRSVANLKCQAVGHEVSLEDEDKMYVSPSREIKTTCSICKKPVLVEMDKTNEDTYFVTEI